MVQCFVPLHVLYGAFKLCITFTFCMHWRLRKLRTLTFKTYGFCFAKCSIGTMTIGNVSCWSKLKAAPAYVICWCGTSNSEWPMSVWWYTNIEERVSADPILILMLCFCHLCMPNAVCLTHFPCLCHSEARFPSWRPELTGDRFPLPVNMGRVDGRAFPLAELTCPST